LRLVVVDLENGKMNSKGRNED